jgi:RHS repeat-associated protein
MQTSSVVRNGTTSGGSVLTTTSYTYDNQGRLTQTGDGTTVSTYAYDAAGNRITQTTGTGSTPITVINYTVDTNNPTGYSQTLEERSTTAAVTTTKTYTIGLDMIAQYDTNSTAGTMTFVYDGHGSTRDVAAVISTVVTVLQSYAYNAYGVRISASNLTSLATAALTSLLYSGEQTDKSGMQYLRARYYRPDVGRFISFDSYAGRKGDPQSLHKYLYAHANPVMGIDPSGYIIFTFIGSNFEYGQIVHDDIGIHFLSTGINRFYDDTVNRILRITSIFGTPRPDLVQKPLAAGGLGLVFEIKPTGSSLAGRLQLATYLTLLNTLDPAKNIWIPGEAWDYTPPPIIPINSFTFAIVTPPVGGIIIYQVVDVRMTLVDIALFAGWRAYSLYLQSGIESRLGQSSLLAALGFV